MLWGVYKIGMRRAACRQKQAPGVQRGGEERGSLIHPTRTRARQDAPGSAFWRPRMRERINARISAKSGRILLRLRNSSPSVTMYRFFR